MDASGALTELAEERVTLRTDDSGTTGTMWVDYCDDQTLKVYVDHEGGTKPTTPEVEVAFDMDTIFSGQDFVTGFSAAVGLIGRYP